MSDFEVTNVNSTNRKSIISDILLINAAYGLPKRKSEQSIKEAPTPTNVTELKFILGLLNYYNRFLLNLCDTLKPLHSLLQKGKQWKWTYREEEAFESIKNKLLNSNFLAHYDLLLPLQLSCDASPYGIGACLTHVYEDGSEQPVAFALRTLSSTEKGYAQVEREALALIFGVRHFHKYLVGRSFTFVTDQKSLTKILGPNKGCLHYLQLGYSDGR